MSTVTVKKNADVITGSDLKKFVELNREYLDKLDTSKTTNWLIKTFKISERVMNKLEDGWTEVFFVNKEGEFYNLSYGSYKALYQLINANVISDIKYSKSLNRFLVKDIALVEDINDKISQQLFEGYIKYLQDRDTRFQTFKGLKSIKEVLMIKA